MVYCIDVGGSFMKFGRVSKTNPLAELGKVPTPLDDFDLFAAAVEAGCGAGTEPVSIALPGVVDPDTGMVTCANVPCIDGRAAGAELQQKLGRPVLLSNDADCFVMAEAAAGAGKGHRIVFGVILGTGVGGGLVIDGGLIRGTSGLTGEWGHGPVVQAPAFVCGCGQKGCLNTIGGARGLERLYAFLCGSPEQAVAAERGGVLTGSGLAERVAADADQSIATAPDSRSSDESLPDSESILALWKFGDPKASETMRVYLELMSGPLAMLVNTLGASVVPVGGGLSHEPVLVAALDEAVRSRILRKTAEALVVPGTVPGEAGLAGAGYAGLKHFYPESPR